jgi:hypothetical protein
MYALQGGGTGGLIAQERSSEATGQQTSSFTVAPAFEIPPWPASAGG